jgi:hypothetical protein
MEILPVIEKEYTLPRGYAIIREKKMGNLKMPTLALALWSSFGLSAASLFLRLQAAGPAARILVRARVLEGGRFADALTREDFVLEEDGRPQKIETLYLVRQDKILRSEPPQDFAPPLGRNFLLLFQMLEYDPKIDQAIHYFFEQVLRPGDTLTLQTVTKVYYLPSAALTEASRQKLADQYVGYIRRDTKDGNSVYGSLIRDLRRIVRSIDTTSSPSFEDVQSDQDAFSLQLLLPQYRETLSKLDAMRAIDERRVLGFAQSLKAVLGTKTVILVYQREFRPEIGPMALQSLSSLYQDDPSIMAGLQDLFQQYSRAQTPDLERMREVFADAEILFNFLFTNYKPKDVSGLVMREQSEDIFRTFSEVARSTGGVVDTSQNLADGFKKAVEAAQDYYLLAYIPPRESQSPGFRKISLRAKNPALEVFHRQGYFR